MFNRGQILAAIHYSINNVIHDPTPNKGYLAPSARHCCTASVEATLDEEEITNLGSVYLPCEPGTTLRLVRGTSHRNEETRNSRSFRHGSVGIVGCGDRI